MSKMTSHALQSPPAAAPAEAKPALISRQPILDRSQRLFAYELRVRETEEARTAAEGDAASSRMFLSAFVDIGLKKLVGENFAFLKLTRNLLFRHADLPFTSNRVVIEVVNDAPVDGVLVEAVRALAARGFAIALGDVDARNPSDEMGELLKLARFVSVDVQAHSDAELDARTRALRGHALKLVAEKVETREQYQRAVDLGFEYFQGYYLCRPELVSDTTLRENKLSVLRLLSAVEDQNNGPSELDAIIRTDAALSYKLLRCVNSAYFALPVKVKSVLHAAVYLGVGRIRNWVRMLALAGLADRPPELLKLALIRARMAEQLACALPKERQEMAFTAGLFSLLDALLNTSMQNVLDRIPLADEIRIAILKNEGPLAHLLDEVRACERGEWDKLDQTDVPADIYAAAYLTAVDWAEQVYSFGGAPSNRPGAPG